MLEGGCEGVQNVVEYSGEGPNGRERGRGIVGVDQGETVMGKCRGEGTEEMIGCVSVWAYLLVNFNKLD